LKIYTYIWDVTIYLAISHYRYESFPPLTITPIILIWGSLCGNFPMWQSRI